MKKTAITFILSALLIIPAFIPMLAGAASETFSHYLQKGDSGKEVLLLQQFLNSDKETQITESGKGSQGRETDFFGELTKQAVIKYQKKNDLGNKYGFFTIYSGALDDKTRAAMNKESENKGFASSCNRKVDLSSQSSIVDLFQKTNKYAETLKPENMATTSDRWAALNEMYRVSGGNSINSPYIENIEISSKSNDNDDSFNPFSPSMSFTSNDKMKITGCNFSTSTPNTVHLTYGDQKVTSTNGTLIEFTPEVALQGMFDDQIKGLLKKVSDSDKVKNKIFDKMKGITNMPGLPLTITVENEKGVSNPYQVYFNLK